MLQSPIDGTVADVPQFATEVVKTLSEREGGVSKMARMNGDARSL